MPKGIYTTTKKRGRPVGSKGKAKEVIPGNTEAKVDNVGEL